MLMNFKSEKSSLKFQFYSYVRPCKHDGIGKIPLLVLKYIFLARSVSCYDKLDKNNLLQAMPSKIHD